MKRKKFKLNEVVKVNGAFFKGYGKITDYNMGINNDWLYKVGERYIPEKDIEKVIDVCDTPTNYYEQISAINERMQGEIYNLVMRHGKEVKRGGNSKGIVDVVYTFRGGAIIKDTNNETLYIKQIKIYNPFKTQVRGHLVLIDDCGKVHSFVELIHQEFNVYSPLFREIFPLR